MEKKAKQEQKYSHMKDRPLIADYHSVSYGKSVVAALQLEFFKSQLDHLHTRQTEVNQRAMNHLLLSCLNLLRFTLCLLFSMQSMVEPNVMQTVLVSIVN